MSRHHCPSRPSTGGRLGDGRFLSPLLQRSFWALPWVYAAGGNAMDQNSVEGSANTVTVTISEDAVPTGPTFLQSGPTGATGATAQAESSLSDPFPRGEAGEAFGWTVKVVDFNPDATDVVEQANQFNAPPRRGTYAVVTVRFSRTGGKSSDPYFDMQAALVVRGQSYAASDEACCIPDAWTDVGKVPSGGSDIGRIAFDVPKGGLDSAVLFLTITDPEGFDEAEGFVAVN